MGGRQKIKLESTLFKIIHCFTAFNRVFDDDKATILNQSDNRDEATPHLYSWREYSAHQKIRTF